MWVTTTAFTFKISLSPPTVPSPPPPLHRAFDYRFSLGLLAKGVDTAMSLLDTDAIRAPVLLSIREMLQAAQVEMGDDVDHLEMVKLLERCCGVELSGFPEKKD